MSFQPQMIYIIIATVKGQIEDKKTMQRCDTIKNYLFNFLYTDYAIERYIFS